jgi:hypothetical protein
VFSLELAALRALLAIVAWLLKTSLKAWIANDAEVFKTRLKADSDIEIEQFKSSLQLIATEHQVRFSKLHERRADIIEELYKRLTDVYWDGQRFVMTSENNPSPYQANEFDKMREKLSEVFMFIEHHRILLPKSVCALLDQHFSHVNLTVYSAGIFGRVKNPSDRTAEQSNDAFEKAYKDFETEIPAARAALEDEFRKMLGADATSPFDQQILREVFVP